MMHTRSAAMQGEADGEARVASVVSLLQSVQGRREDGPFETSEAHHTGWFRVREAASTARGEPDIMGRDVVLGNTAPTPVT